jgi:hypothetical protein
MKTKIRIVYSSVLICLICQTVHAQQQPVFEKKIIKDPDGTIYWPLSLPVYLQLASQADAKDMVSLTNVKDESMKEIGFPMKWDGPGVHYIRHFDNQNSKLKDGEVAYPVQVDGAAPLTKLNLAGAPLFKAAKLYFGKGLSGAITAQDDMSKVSCSYFSINGSDYAEYKSSLPFSEEKEYSIKYFSFDRVGNTEEPKSKTFTVDVTPPTTSHTFATDHLEGKILSPRTLITLSSADNLSGVANIKTAFDANPLTRYYNKISPANLTDGDHTLLYTAIDNVSNSEANAQYPFYLDKTAPVITSAIDANFVKVGSRLYIAKASTIQLSATDNKAGVKQVYYTVNGGTEKLYSMPFTVSKKQGAYIVKFRGIDNVNNKGPFTTDDNLGDLFIDDTPPQLSHTVNLPKVFTRDTLFITKDSKIDLRSIDLESGSAKIEYQIGNGTTATYSKPLQIATDGKHTLTYTGFDKVNNSISKSYLVIVDNVAPVVFTHFSLQKMGTNAGLSIYPAGTTVYLAATDDVVGTKAIYYSMNNQPEVAYSSTLKLINKGKNLLKVRAVDNLGNQSTIQEIAFFVK